MEKPMPHITLPEGEPGIIGLLVAYRQSEAPLNALANAVMRGPSSLTPAERELISAYVSNENECSFCMNAHAAATRHLLGDHAHVVDQVLANLDGAAIDEKLRALLVIAGKVRQDGRTVTEADISRARQAGADDKAIHDTVLIAAMFCMFNRYVDGLATTIPRDPALYDEIGKRIAFKGYGSRFREAAS
jgi:uncharacterized peroxidase-related enzyme